MADKKNLLIIIAFILIIAIPVTVYFVRQSQIFKSRASATSGAEFLDASGNPLPVDSNGIAQTTDPNVKLRIVKTEASPSPN